MFSFPNICTVQVGNLLIAHRNSRTFCYQIDLQNQNVSFFNSKLKHNLNNFFLTYFHSKRRTCSNSNFYLTPANLATHSVHELGHTKLPLNHQHFWHLPIPELSKTWFFLICNCCPALPHHRVASHSFSNFGNNKHLRIMPTVHLWFLFSWWLTLYMSWPTQGHYDDQYLWRFY